MLYLSENLKKYRLLKGLTQEEVAEYLMITPQSVSKWERAESYPDITFLPALANIFETSVDLLLGMDTIRAEETLHNIHNKAVNHQNNNNYKEAEKIYRDALLIYPNNESIIFGLASTLALMNNSVEAIKLIERGLKTSTNEKQRATMRATLCFLYLKINDSDKALKLALELPHTRESREVISPIIKEKPTEEIINQNIRYIILGKK